VRGFGRHASFHRRHFPQNFCGCVLPQDFCAEKSR
jgi:hypothetical protein